MTKTEKLMILISLAFYTNAEIKPPYEYVISVEARPLLFRAILEACRKAGLMFVEGADEPYLDRTALEEIEIDGS